MTKRANDPTVRTMICERRGPLRSAICRRTLLICTVVAAALGGGATSSHGISGESPDTVGLLQTACQNPRAETVFPGGDEIFFCDRDGEQCRLSSEATALGFCSDSYATVVPIRGVGPLEVDEVVEATTFGAVHGVVGSTGDILCETFETEKFCVHVFEGACTEDTCETGGPIDVEDNSCDTVQALLAGSVDPSSNISWWLFIDVNILGQEGSEKLLVCPGFAWDILPLDGSTIADQVTVKYLAVKYLKSPTFVTISGARICKLKPGEPASHCP